MSDDTRIIRLEVYDLSFADAGSLRGRTVAPYNRSNSQVPGCRPSHPQPPGSSPS